jgi:hypothetical protein
LNFDRNVSGFLKYYKIFILHPTHWSVSKETESLFIRKTTIIGSDIHIHENQNRTIGITSVLFLPKTIVPIAEGFVSGLFAFGQDAELPARMVSIFLTFKPYLYFCRLFGMADVPCGTPVFLNQSKGCCLVSWKSKDSKASERKSRFISIGV